MQSMPLPRFAGRMPRRSVRRLDQQYAYIIFPDLHSTWHVTTRVYLLYLVHVFYINFTTKYDRNEYGALL